MRALLALLLLSTSAFAKSDPLPLSFEARWAHAIAQLPPATELPPTIQPTAPTPAARPVFRPAKKVVSRGTCRHGHKVKISKYRWRCRA